MNPSILAPEWFQRPTLEVSKELLGKYLVNTAGMSGQIHEVEAYIGEEDQACHARFGRTKRSEPLYGPPGHFYVYLIYGMYWMLNIVTERAGYPAAVLIRGVGDFMGPGKVTRAFEIDKSLNQKPTGPKTGLWVEDRGVIIPSQKILATPRIGIDYAGEWKEKKWRFVIM